VNNNQNDDGSKTLEGFGSAGPPLQSQASTISKVTTSILRVNSLQTYGTSQQGRSKKKANFADPIDNLSSNNDYSGRELNGGDKEEIKIKVFTPDDQQLVMEIPTSYVVPKQKASQEPDNVNL
jgi:hypothetical protein